MRREVKQVSLPPGFVQSKSSGYGETVYRSQIIPTQRWLSFLKNLHDERYPTTLTLPLAFSSLEQALQ
jgi:hypothetical protein